MNSKTGSREALLNSGSIDSEPGSTNGQEILEDSGSLTAEEKRFLLMVERGDVANVKRLLDSHKGNPDVLSVDCTDPLGRSALIMGIENENYELIEMLLNEGCKVKDALLHAIKEEYVEAVELLLEWEEVHHQAGTPYSWEAADRDTAKFTPDITPLILAAHKNNYEIIKILLDRGATLPVPHDVKCGCDTCVTTSTEDSLRYSMSRINAYRALASPSLICLSSKDPFLTAFELSWELRRLAKAEAEFRADYNELRSQCQDFATTLLGHARTSVELQTLLNHRSSRGGDEGWEPGEKQGLERLKLAIKYKQKKFVAHPSVQQLLAAMWYEGLPGFRRKTLSAQIVDVAKLGMSFPLNCASYMLRPGSERGQFMKKPFVKFISHSSSYVFFLTLLAAASQRLEFVVLEFFGNAWIHQLLQEWQLKERGGLPGLVESAIVLYIVGWIWTEIKSLWSDGIVAYVSDLWNIVDLITNTFYVTWIALRVVAFYIVMREESQGINPYYPREHWDMFDPMLLSEGMFGAAMIFSFLKLVHMFSINPHLGPLQISLGRMVVDILKFFFIYSLVLFAFGCGLNQLLWYYADLEKKKCYGPEFIVGENGEKELLDKGDSCFIWRRFANLFETSQSLFWASFGLVELDAFDLQGIQGFTRFWGLLMFGSYSVINVIVLLNMLIAMMSTSYQIISERSDTEWKFARSTLWISYFDEGATVPAPFNIVPTVKSVQRLFGVQKEPERKPSIKRRGAMERYLHITRLLVRRYVSSEETKKQEEAGITEDDVNEIRQDISSFRYELVDILKVNGMRTPNLQPGGSVVAGRKGKVMERRLMKDFQIGCVENAIKEAIAGGEAGTKDVFSRLAKAIGRKKDKKDWNAMVRQASVRSDPIGSKQTSLRRRSQRRRRVEQENAALFSMDPDILAEYNPKLQEVTPATRVAYAKFKTKFLISHIDEEDSEPASPSARARHFASKRSRQGQSMRRPGSIMSTSSKYGGGGGGGGATVDLPMTSPVSELEKSTEKLDETPVLKPILTQLSLKKAADEKLQTIRQESLETQKSAEDLDNQDALGQTQETPLTGDTVIQTSSSTKASPTKERKTAESPAKPVSVESSAPSAEPVKIPSETPPPAKEGSPTGKAVTPVKAVPPVVTTEVASTSSSSKETVAVDDEQPSTSKAAKSDYTVVHMDPEKASEGLGPKPARGSSPRLTPEPVQPPRSPSPSGKSAVTGQTRTGWL
ncbi:unnamed protein product [Allacma fusca]|uniref:Transient receptor ion channel domain-containing protein n=1 Tax=Allacma fusca TaxID=39272 RepID=A0A8J2JII9_9HEXA|nr:unnamed protein product [Allacma fusca]